MTRGTIALCSLVAGCSTPVDPGVLDSGGDPSSVSYVIGALDTNVPNDSTATHAFGFDLDPGAAPPPAGSRCGVNDWIDPYDPTATHVDNQLVDVLGAIGNQLGPDGVDGALRIQIELGRLLLLLQLGGVDSYADDSNVVVHVAFGAVHTPACSAHSDMAGCGADSPNRCTWVATSMGAGTCNAAPMPSSVCTMHTDQASCIADMRDACSWSDMAMGCSGIAPSQLIATSMELGTMIGSITHGRLAFVLPVLPMHIVGQGHDIVLLLHDVHFAGHITQTSITEGEFGAHVLFSDVLSPIRDFGSGSDPATVESIVMPDLLPIADTTAQCATHNDVSTCTSDVAAYCSWTNNACVGATAGSHCAAISMGLGFSAISAILD